MYIYSNLFKNVGFYMLKVQEIREIIRLIDESSINEFTYESNGTKVKLKKSMSGEIVQADPSKNLVESTLEQPKEESKQTENKAEIGRASCREREKSSADEGGV